ncbi:hypothetical protein JOE58_002785 [Curtobacterium luteum]|uniref:Uncharacterized protein n=1 Tax=Curtobacterium luteum TaxID=33881 RepID=A0A8H9GAR5_9MICO|nr:hypothetical protein [Curtobacterium luteum]MBM7803534.1 hypothetical protein [Curtobacterium luteum]NUU50191.1 hypothetical protein [Curtobacterium luteum]GGK99837.1 hypothetical protein GCM10009769_17500 [Curtobacterium luteum]
MTAVTPGPADRENTDRRSVVDANDVGDLDAVEPEDAFGHPVLGDPVRDEPWADGDEDDVDV